MYLNFRCQILKDLIVLWVLCFFLLHCGYYKYGELYSRLVTNFSLVNFNIYRIRNKTTDSQCFQFEVVCLTEAWLSKDKAPYFKLKGCDIAVYIAGSIADPHIDKQTEKALVITRILAL